VDTTGEEVDGSSVEGVHGDKFGKDGGTVVAEEAVWYIACHDACDWSSEEPPAGHEEWHARGCYSWWRVEEVWTSSGPHGGHVHQALREYLNLVQSTILLS
jgi:hypothetical protein